MAVLRNKIVWLAEGLRDWLQTPCYPSLFTGPIGAHAPSLLRPCSGRPVARYCAVLVIYIDSRYMFDICSIVVRQFVNRLYMCYKVKFKWIYKGFNQFSNEF